MSEWEIIEEIKENASIKVIGVGGGGGNAVQHMVECGIEGATELAEEIFHSPVRMGSPHSVEGFSEIINNPVYATSVGLLLYGQKQMQEDHLNYIHRDKNILNRISRWFGGNL